MIGNVRRWRDPGAGRVERQLPGWDAHPADSLIAEPEDAFPVGDDDDGRRPRVIPEDGIDLVALVVRDVETARATKDVRELLARFADDRRVDDRHHLVDVVVEETEEQRLVPVLQAGEVDIALERCRLDTIVLVHAGQLLVHGADGRRQEPVEAEVGALALGECRAFIRQGIAEQRLTARVNGDVFLARDPIVLGQPFHRSPSWRLLRGFDANAFAHEVSRAMVGFRLGIAPSVEGIRRGC